MATYCGQNKGAGRNDRIAKGIVQTLIMCFVITAVLSGIVYLFRTPLIGVFGIAGQSRAYCMEHLSFMCFAFVLFGIYFPGNGMLQGTGEGFWATFCALTALGSRVLFAYTLNGPVGYPILWYSMAMSWALAAIVCYSHILTGRWKRVALR